MYRIGTYKTELDQVGSNRTTVNQIGPNRIKMDGLKRKRKERTKVD